MGKGSNAPCVLNDSCDDTIQEEDDDNDEEDEDYFYDTALFDDDKSVDESLGDRCYCVPFAR